MFTIDSIELFLCEFKSEGLNYSTWSTNTREFLVYKINSGNFSGWGESTINYNCYGVAKRIGKRIVGKDLSKKEELIDPKILKDNIIFQYYAGFNRRYRQIREGFSQALWDIHGKILDKPFSEMIGKHQFVNKNISQEGMPVIHVFEPEDMAKLANLWLKEGFTTFKLKLRGNAKEDIKAMKMIKSLSSEVNILIGDANYGYKSIKELENAANGFIQNDLGFLQNPIRKPFWQYKKISEKLGIKFTSDNTSYWPNIIRVIKFQEAELINLHPNIMGGVDYLFNVFRYAKKNKIKTIVGSSGFCGIQDKCYQKMSFCLDNEMPTENIGLQNYFCKKFNDYYKYSSNTTSILKNDLQVKEGRIYERDESGFGIEVDQSKLDLICKEHLIFN